MLANTLAINLTIQPQNHTVDGLVEHYNIALALSLGSIAPLITRSVFFARPTPWFTPELPRLKSIGCRLERLYKRPGLTVLRKAYRDHVKDYKEALSLTKTLYYSKHSNTTQKHPKQYFSTITLLLNLPDAPQPSDAADLCSRFLDFFNLLMDGNPPSAAPDDPARRLHKICRIQTTHMPALHSAASLPFPCWSL